MLCFKSMAQTTVAIPFEEADYVTVMEAAKSQQRNVLFYFTHPYCAPCKIMERTVLNQPKIIQMVNETVIPVKVDCVDEKPYAKAIQQQFQIQSFPTVILVDSTGKLIRQYIGFMDQDAFLLFMQSSKLKAD